jgi:hypothetical protein
MYGTPIFFAQLSTSTTNWTVTGIPQGYKHIEIMFGVRTDFAFHGPQFRWSWNNESGTNTHYSTIINENELFVYGPEGGSFRQRSILRGDGPANMFVLYQTIIPNYASTAIKKTVLAQHAGVFGDPLNSTPLSAIQTNVLDNTTALSSITFYDNSGSVLSPGSWVHIYGLGSS